LDPLDRIRAMCLSLPEAFEVEAWAHPTFRVGAKRGKMFCIAGEDGAALRVKADPIEREALLEHGEPYYFPPYVGDKGWLGIRTDSDGVSWEEIAELIATSYCLVAPKRIAEQVTEAPSVPE
jgi:predicted DNA-binding protein (MmcQ/YjbR family)